MNPLVGIALLLGGLVWLSKSRERPRRRNLDAFTKDGVIHPIRGSEGYNDETERIAAISIKTGGAKPPEKRVKISEHIKEIPIKVMGKPLSEPPTATEWEKMKRLGSLWERGDKKRIYFNDLPGIYGLETSRYHTGNISSATLDGERISNTYARKLESALSGKLWFDSEDDKFHWKGLSREDGLNLASILRAKAK